MHARLVVAATITTTLKTTRSYAMQYILPYVREMNEGDSMDDEKELETFEAAGAEFEFCNAAAGD